ncbi:hypothetical protein IAT38_002755 [Cryptococcus sp. DSM 104549]
MRLPLSALSSLLLLPLSLASSAQQPLQVYLHPTPQHPSSSHPSHLTPPTLSAEQAKAVLAHHLGQDLADFEEIPQDEGLWAHLMGMWEGVEGGKAKVVVVDGGVEAQDVLPTSLPPQPSFYLKDDIRTHSLLQPYLTEAKDLLAHILDALPEFTKSFKDIFDLAGTKAAAVLSHELSCLTALADSIPWINHSGQYPWEAITISGLGDVQRGDEVWETGRQGVKAGLEAMTTPDSPPLLLIIRPSSSTSRKLVSRAAPVALTYKSNTTLAEACYTSNETCSEATSCNGRGACGLQGKSGDSECWGCKCRNGYAGVECQKDDYSTSFIIIVFSALLLGSVTIGGITLLASIGDTKLPSTLTLAVGSASKHD